MDCHSDGEKKKKKKRKIVKALGAAKSTVWCILIKNKCSYTAQHLPGNHRKQLKWMITNALLG